MGDLYNSAHTGDGFVAVVDESTPEDGVGVFYVVTAAILLRGRGYSAERLTRVVAGEHRTRPFHWHREGSTTRSKMISCLEEIGAYAHVHVTHPVGRKKQEVARSSGLLIITDRVMDDGATDLVVESRTADMDWRDSRTLAPYAELGLSWEFRTKQYPLLWAADAICGAVREYMLGDSTNFKKLDERGIIGDLSYGPLP